MPDSCATDGQGCCPLGGGRAAAAAHRIRMPPDACLQCHGTVFTTTCGESTCGQCGVVRPYAERISRHRNGGGIEEEDGTVRADAPCAPRRTPPPSSAAAQRNQMREALNLSNASMPHGLALVQRISERAAVDAALTDEGADVPRSMQLRGFRLQAELAKHLEVSYRLTADMVDRAQATAKSAWQRIEAHHRACTAESSTRRPCHRDLSSCPPVLLSLICLSICLEATLLDVVSTDDGGRALETLGGAAALREAASFVRTHMLRIGTANEKNTNRTLIVARQLMDDAVVSRRCDAGEGPADGHAHGSGRLAVHAHLAATSGGGGGGPVAQSMRYRERRSEPSDDGSSVSSLSVDLPSSPSPRQRTPSSVRQAFAMLHQSGLRMNHATKQATMRAIASPQFGAALLDDDFVRAQSPSVLAAVLAYNVSRGVTPSSSSSSSLECMETGGGGSDASSTRSLGPSTGAASPIRRGRGDAAANFAAAAKMDAVQFRTTARHLAELQCGDGVHLRGGVPP